MQILRILQNSQPSSVDLVREIAFLYKSDQRTNGILTKAVKVIVKRVDLINNYVIIILQDVLPKLPIQDLSAVNLPVKVVGNFLRRIFANLSPNICLYPIIPSQPTPMPAVLPMNSKFTLHSVHNLNPLQMLQLIFTVFDGVPNSFQMFQCTPNTTKQHLDIFFDRAFHWSDLQYLVFGVNYLHNELQEVY